MKSVQEIRTERIRARIPGHVLCRRAGLHRSRLSDIERGAILPTHDELARIERALLDLVEARKKLAAFAEQCGWPLET